MSNQTTETFKSINIWDASTSEDNTVFYFSKHPWEWVMDSLVKDHENIVAVDSAEQLPLTKQLQEEQSLLQAGEGSLSSSPIPGTPPTRRTRRSARGRPKGSQGRSSLKLDVVDKKTGKVVFAARGTSACFEGLGDKDELVRTMQRCRCEQIHLSPPSILIQWDASKEECRNIVGSELPLLKDSKKLSTVAVLKEPMGSQGKGIYFVRNAEEIHQIISENHRRVSEEPDLLETLIAAKGRIPSWVLQAEVYPPLLVRDQRKFHIRSYLVVLERPDDEVLDMLIYSRHEVRIAGKPIETEGNESRERDPQAHITNGSFSGSTSRILLSEEEELVKKGLTEKVELFIAEVFGKHLLSDISRRIPPPAPHHPPIREFAVAGLDLMVTEDLRVYLLEANVNPYAPSEAMCDQGFSDHLHGFFRDLVNLVTIGVQSGANFHDAFEILERQETS